MTLAIKFDLDWFLTIPGMLITGGVLLLLIALIIFIATAGSGKKKNKNEKNVTVQNNMETNVAPVMDNTVEQQPVEENVPVTPIPDATVAPVEEVTTPVVEATPEEIPNAVEEAESPIVESSQPMEKEEPVENPQDINAAFIPAVDETSVEMPVEVKEEEIKEENTIDPVVSIYGGVSPIVPTVENEPEERTIYGGANPLEKTQAIPVIDQAPRVEYGIPIEEKEEPENVEEVKETQPIEDITNIEPVEAPVEKVENTFSKPEEKASGEEEIEILEL